MLMDKLVRAVILVVVVEELIDAEVVVVVELDVVFVVVELVVVFVVVELVVFVVVFVDELVVVGRVFGPKISLVISNMICV